MLYIQIMNHLKKRRDGFAGQKLISLPEAVNRKALQANPFLAQLYITHIGYFPRAAFHYRERRQGCADNILIYCLQGKGWYVIGNKRYEVGPNEYILLPATTRYMRYGADDDDPWTIYWVHFSGRNMNMFNRTLQIGEDDGPRRIPFNEKGIRVWETMYQSLEMGFSGEHICNANFCLYQFVATFLFTDHHVKAKKPRDIIAATISHMRQKLHQRLTVEDFARMHNISASYFSMMFRKATGMPPLDYFIHLKIQKACQLLYGNDTRIRDIGAAIGYDDPYYFSRLFKKYMKVSPEQYRVIREKDASPA